MTYEYAAQISLRNYIASRSAPVQKWRSLPPVEEGEAAVQLKLKF
jgi:hypothetical protein